MKDRILYRSGYKYQLAHDYVIGTGLLVAQPIKTEFLRLSHNGILTILQGYAWDGPSGPAIDTKSAMRGSLVHDALFQLLRRRLLAPEFEQPANEVYRRLCLEDGMWRIRAWAHFDALSIFGHSAADPKNEKPILEAP